MDTPGLLALIDQANAARRGGAPDPAAEARLEALHQVGARLAVYGTLGPGRPNHHVVAPLGGAWSTGVVEGDLRTFGWGALAGFPALELRPGGPRVAVALLDAEPLRTFWPRLDAFEGSEYRRILVPVWSDEPGPRTLVAVANLYEAALPAPGLPLGGSRFGS